MYGFRNRSKIYVEMIGPNLKLYIFKFWKKHDFKTRASLSRIFYLV
jgi:hypothetical protein